MQRDIEHSRMTAVGKCTDGGSKCTLLVVHEVGGHWCLYPHGWGKFGVRLPEAEAVKVARAILDGAGLDGASQLGVRLPRDEAVRVARAILDHAGLDGAR